MKNNTVVAKTSISETVATEGIKQDLEIWDKQIPLPAEMMNLPDAREIREFIKSYLSIEDHDMRKHILKEVRSVSEQNE